MMTPTPTPDPFFSTGSDSVTSLPPEYFPLPNFYTLPTPTPSPAPLPLCGPFVETFSPSFSFIKSGLLVSFTDTTITNRKITSWYWTFGDGSFVYQQNPAKLYTSSGTYIVNLTVTLHTGTIGNYSQNIFVP